MTRIRRLYPGALLLASMERVVSRSIGDIIAAGFGLSQAEFSSTASFLNTSASLEPSNSPIIATSTYTGTNTTACWSSWREYWAYTNAIARPETSYLTTIVSSTTGYQSEYPGTTETDVETLKGTSVQDNGGFTINTKTLDSTSTTVYTISPRPASSYTITTTITSYTLMPYNGSSVPIPTCTLSSVVLQCQKQWEAYVSSELLPSPTPPRHCDINQGIVTALTYETQPPCAFTYQSSLSSWRSQLSSITKPLCTQASVGGQLCSTIKDAYVHQQNSVFFPNVSFAPYFSNGYLGSFANITAGNYTKSWWWPTSSTLGVPGCTLECGRCAVTGNTVQLLYWPEATQSEARADHDAPLTISTLGTVLTSPTYYVSYRSVFASDGCSGVGPTLYNIIVPIPGGKQLSSVFGGTLPCVAHVQNAFTQEFTATASFNVRDLVEPVPFSIYSSQPWCATYQFEHGCNEDCPTTEAYKPIIVVPEVVLQNMDLAWASCYGDIRGVYDPPIALTQVASVKGPQLTASVPTMSEAIGATPASLPPHPAAETSAATMNPGNLLFNSAAASVPQSSTESSQDHGGVSIATAHPDDLPSSNAGVAPHAPEFSDSGPNIGDVLAAILGGTDHPDGEEMPPSSGLLPTGTANLVSEMTLSSSTADSRESQASQPAEPDQAVGDIIASIAGDAGRLSTYTSVSTHPPQYIPGNEWDSALTPVSVSGNRPHRPSHSGIILDSEQAYQTPTAQAPAFTTPRYPLTSGGVQRSGTSSGLLEDKPPAISDNGSGAIEPMSTQASTESTPLNTETPDSVAASASMAGTMSSGSERMMCGITIMVNAAGFYLLQML